MAEIQLHESSPLCSMGMHCRAAGVKGHSRGLNTVILICEMDISISAYIDTLVIFPKL